MTEVTDALRRIIDLEDAVVALCSIIEQLHERASPNTQAAIEVANGMKGMYQRWSEETTNPDHRRAFIKAREIMDDTEVNLCARIVERGNPAAN